MSGVRQIYTLYSFRIGSNGPVWGNFGQFTRSAKGEKFQQKTKNENSKGLLRIRCNPYIVALIATIAPILHQSECFSIIANIAFIAITFQISNNYSQLFGVRDALILWKYCNE